MRNTATPPHAPVITLLTDFGLRDPYVGIMKGVILSICKNARIVDIGHHIPPQDIVQGSMALQSAYRFFPEGTLHLCVVDPEVGSDRSIVAVETARYIFLAPDNGLLWPILETEKTRTIVKVSNQTYYRHPVSRTFHGRDIFAPIAAHIACGVRLTELGPVLKKSDLTVLTLPQTVISDDNRLYGMITGIDRFGNLTTNLKLEAIYQLTGSPDTIPVILVGDKRINGISTSYSSVARQQPLAVIGSSGYLEIAVNCGNAQNHFEMQVGDAVQVCVDPG